MLKLGIWRCRSGSYRCRFFCCCWFVETVWLLACSCNYALSGTAIHHPVMFFFMSLSLQKIIKSRNDNIISLLLWKFASRPFIHKRSNNLLSFFPHVLHLPSSIWSLFVICLYATFYILYITEHCVNVYSFNFVNEKATGAWRMRFQTKGRGKNIYIERRR